MRTIAVLSAFLFISLLSCSKDEEWQTLNMTGAYTNTPDFSAGFHNVALPNDVVMQVPKKYKVSGSDNLIGTIDDTKSNLEVKAVTSVSKKTTNFKKIVSFGSVNLMVMLGLF